MTEGTRRENVMRFVIFEEEGGYVAVCLEHHVGAQGRSMDEVKQRLQTAYRAELDESRARTGIPFDGIGPAPERFHAMWNDPAVTRGDIFEKRDNHLELWA